MRKVNVVMRILCSVLDVLVIMIPIQFIMLGVFRVSGRQADMFFQLLLAVYGALLTEYWGKTPGKYFGSIRCVDVSGRKAGILYVGIRELVKAVYFVPVVGWIAAGVSVVMMIGRKDGRTLHDLAGNTKVIYKWQIADEEKEYEHQ